MKTIKLHESDLINIVKRVMVEQGLPPFPDKQQELNRTPTQILQAKKNVFQSLNSAISSIKQLIELSGVNPDNNNIVSDIEKVKEKFDNLFGNSKPKQEKNEG